MATPRSPLWRPVAIGLLASVVALAEARHGYFPFDEGMLLYAAHSILQGEGLYDHVRLNCGPGIVWVVAAIFSVSGESFLAVRLFMALSFVALCFLLRSILRAVGATDEADLAALGAIGARAFLHPHWLMVSYTSLSVLVYFAAVRLLLARSPRFGAAGAAAAAAFALKQNVGAMAGLVVVAAVVVLPIPRRGQALLRSAAAAALVVAAMVGGIAWSGSLAGFFHHAIAVNARFADTWHMPFPLFRPTQDLVDASGTFYYLPSRVVGLIFARPELHGLLLRTGLQALVIRLAYGIPLLVIAAALVQGLARRDDRRLLLIPLSAAILLLMAWPVPTILHWSNASLGALLAAASWCRGSRGRIRALAVAMGLLAAAGLTLSGALVVHEQSPLRLSIGTVMTNAGNARRVGSVLSYLSEHARPEDHIFVVPYAPLYYLTTGRDNPIADDYVIPPWSDAARLAALAAELEQHQVRFVIWSRTELPRFPRFEAYGAPLAEAIRTRYRLVFKSAGGPPHDEVWERIAATP